MNNSLSFVSVGFRFSHVGIAEKYYGRDFHVTYIPMENSHEIVGFYLAIFSLYRRELGISLSSA